MVQVGTTIINLADYELSGGGKLGESYTHRSNPDVLLKLYSKQLEALGLEEHERACKVFRTGVPCPEPGELVRTEDGRLGILYKRIIGKKSYARALSEHPERLEEYAGGFAAVCKKLHSLKPEPGMFPTAKEQYKKEIGRNPFLTAEERDGLRRFIDLSDFCTGTPLFDLGIIMLQTCWLPEETERELYHIGLDTSRAFWKAFVPAYFGANASPDEVQAMLQPYAFLRILVTERLTGTPIGRIRPPVHKMIGL